MTHSALHGLIDQAGLHPELALLAVTLVAFAESLAVVGTFVPAAIAMFCAGVLVGQGTLGMAATLACAVAGASAGDALSYELGRLPRARDAALRIAARRAALLARAEALVLRRGVASVLIARFTGPLRAFVPLLAGLARMPRPRFYLVNIASACLWAPVHVLPGVLFGSSLQLAEAVSGRLALLLVLLVALVWFAAWAVTSVRRLLGALLATLRDAAVGRLRRHQTRWARAGLVVLEPVASGSQSMLAGMALLLAAGWLFLGIAEDVVTHDALVEADRSVFTFLQQLRTVAVDRAMVLLTEAGSVGVLLPLIVTVFAWLLWRRCWRTAAYWAASAAFAELLVQVLKRTLGRQRPLVLYQGGEAFSFPSGHATVTLAVLGLLAFLLARGQSRRWRSWVAGLAAAYVVLVAFSRLYLGAHWFSDVVGGMSLALAWVAFVAMVYTRRGVAEPFPPRQLAVVSLLAIVVSTALWHHWRGPLDQRLYAAVPQPRAVSVTAWAGGEWRQLPLQRREAAGDPEERFPLQWACAAREIEQHLAAAGWRPATAWSLSSTLLALAGSPPLVDLPVLPRLDQGRHARLNFVAPGADARNERQVLRLWRSDVVLAAGDPAAARVPLWYGAVYAEQRASRPFAWLREGAGDAQPLLLALVAQGAPRLSAAPGATAAAPPTLLACGVPVAINAAR